MEVREQVFCGQKLASQLSSLCLRNGLAALVVNIFTVQLKTRYMAAGSSLNPFVRSCVQASTAAESTAAFREWQEEPPALAASFRRFPPGADIDVSLLAAAAGERVRERLREHDFFFVQQALSDEREVRTRSALLKHFLLALPQLRIRLRRSSLTHSTRSPTTPSLVHPTPGPHARPPRPAACARTHQSP